MRAGIGQCENADLKGPSTLPLRPPGNAGRTNNWCKLSKRNWWTHQQTKMPDKEVLDDWHLQKDYRNAPLMNEQLYKFLWLKLKDDALTVVKNMKMKPGVHRVARWWKSNHDCQGHL